MAILARDVEARVRINNMEMSQSSNPNGGGLYGGGNQSAQVKIEEFQIKLNSSVLSMDQLRVLIQDWLNEYQEFKAPNKHLRFFLYR